MQKITSFVRCFAFGLGLFSVLALPAAKAAEAPSASPEFKTWVPDAAKLADSVVANAAGISWKSLESQPDVLTRQRLQNALVTLGSPDLALRYADAGSVEAEEIWRVTARIQTQAGSIDLARKALSHLPQNAAQARTDASFAIARAQLRAGDKKGAANTLKNVLNSLKEVDNADAYTYGAMLLSRAGDAVSMKKVLAWRSTLDTDWDLGDKNDRMSSREFFRLKAGLEITRDWRKITFALRKDVVHTLAASRRFARAIEIASLAGAAQQRAFLLAEIARYQQHYTGSAPAIEQCLKEIPVVIKEVTQKKGTDAVDELARIAGTLTYLHHQAQAEDFIGKLEKATGAAKRTATPKGISVWRALYYLDLLRPLNWLSLDEKKRSQIEKVALAGELESAGLSRSGGVWRLFFARRQTGPRESALKALEAATKIEQGEKNSDSIFGGPESLLRASREWRKLGETKRADDLAREALPVFLKRNPPTETAISFAECGATELAYQTFPHKSFKRGMSPDYFDLAQAESVHFRASQIPEWISRVTDKKNRTDALCGFVSGRKEERPTAITNEEYELEIPVIGSLRIEAVYDPLNSGWNTLPAPVAK